MFKRVDRYGSSWRLMSVENRPGFGIIIRGRGEYYKPIVYLDIESIIGYQYNHE
jgi:hypothetical protein